MRLALISDIHGNLPALESVLKSIESERIDRVICLGDIVGYGARPNECLEALRRQGIPCIMGNHDATVIGRLALSVMNSHARDAAEWTIKNIRADQREFLAGLPLTMELPSIFCVHSSPNEPEQWHYLFNISDAASAFRAFEASVCFFGHTHFPTMFTNPHDGRRLINVGSVGQPRDRDPRACYGIFDTASMNFRWVRVEYSVAEASKQILEAGLPQFLADRLVLGI